MDSFLHILTPIPNHAWAMLLNMAYENSATDPYFALYV